MIIITEPLRNCKIHFRFISFLSPSKLPNIDFQRFGAYFLHYVKCGCSSLLYQNNAIELLVYLMMPTTESTFIFTVRNYKYGDIYIHSIDIQVLQIENKYVKGL